MASGSIGRESYDQAVLEGIMGSAEIRSEVAEATKLLSTKTSARRYQLHEAHEKTFNRTLSLIEELLDEAKLEKG